MLLEVINHLLYSEYIVRIERTIGVYGKRENKQWRN